jgi:murein L,D-transpeptidase YafK
MPGLLRPAPNIIYHPLRTNIRRQAHRLLLTLLLCLPVPLLAQQEVRIVVDSEHSQLSVYAGDQLLRRYSGIAIGRGGASLNRQLGDGSTPKGHFRVSWVNEDSPFRRFFGLDFPNRAHADRALRDGRISRAQWRAIRNALALGKPPPSNTPLGGRIGIHGLGNADPAIHARFNWTQGCIAVTNAQIDELSQWLLPGTPVEIR